MEYSDQSLDAFSLMHELHRDQRRKGSGTPYIAHLLSTAALVAEYGGDEEQFIAALLHDAVEDRGGLATFERIRVQFGERVAGFVWLCSDSHSTPKPPWRERKVNHIMAVAQAGPDAKLIVAGDKLHNARSIVSDLRIHGESVWGRFQGGKEGSLWYYRAMLEGLRRNWCSPILDDLDLVVRQLHGEA